MPGKLVYISLIKPGKSPGEATKEIIMAGTKYEIVRNGKVVETRSEKAAAIKLATEPGDTVRTQTGTVVHETPAARTRFAPYTRVDSKPVVLAPGVLLPKGYVVAYRLPRDKHVILRAKDKSHLLTVNLVTGETHEFETTREASSHVYLQRPVDKQPKQVRPVEKKAKGKKHLTAVA